MFDIIFSRDLFIKGKRLKEKIIREVITNYSFRSWLYFKPNNIIWL
ncbi:hypothetical protein DICTH_1819 [Dictyoglomus thermophilum H-6-12]|uniref:Uncharacterized protein n=1 Tax=Dictyoglomus thermophilum (strain ATCC 35947 / DSM 3960 / H-6-12) TaxID=309799 RepID=B5YBA2_DICT6|nr:hypothetical protein DICTH_1819 [Dictyoglomus thermophilum H-6-12]